MPSILDFDEINKLTENKRAIPFEEYFGEMALSKTEIKKRINFAHSLHDECFVYIMILMLNMLKYKNEIDWHKIKSEIVKRYKNIADEYIVLDSEFLAYIEVFADDFVKTTQKHTPALIELKRKEVQKATNGEKQLVLSEHKKEYSSKNVGNVVFQKHEQVESEKTKMENQNESGELYFFSEDRINVISENEVNTARNYDEYKTAVDTEKKSKKWITEKDNKVRHTHYEVDEKIIGIDELFRVGRSLMRFPHDPNGFPEEIINCRCTIEYY